MSLSAIALFLVPFLVPTAAATERWAEVWAEADGLPSQNVISVAQGPDGAIWLSTLVGPVRYDGHAFEQVGEPVPVRRIRFGASGALQIPRSRRGVLRWLDGAVVAGPDDEPLTNVRDAIEHEGRLWVGHGSVVRERSDDGWREVVEAGIVRRFQVAEGELLATTTTGIWRVYPDPAEQIVDHPGLVVGRRHRGSWLLGDEEGRLLRLSESAPDAEVLVEGLGYPAHAVVREEAAWWAFERGVVRVGADGRVERAGMADVGSPGELFVDREGSLWLPGVRGLARFAEPDTLLWTVADGVPSTAIDGIVGAGPDRWLRTRDVAIRLGPGGVVARGAARKPLALCVDDGGTAWTGGGVPPTWEPIVEVDPGGPDSIRTVEHPFRGCASGSEGTFIALGTAIHRASGALEAVGAAPQGAEAGELVSAGVAGDRWGWLVDDRFCTADPEGPWACEDTPVAFDSVVGDWAVGDDRLWRRGSAWTSMPTDAPVTAIARTAEGEGIWALGIGLAARLDPSGHVVERLGGRHGLFDRSPTALLEDPDGTVWIGSRTGVTRVPAHARTDVAEVPAVSFADIRVDGLAVPSAAVDASLDIPWDQNHLTVRLVSRAFRDPEAVRYRIRVDGDALEAADGVFRFVGLGAGTYTLVGQARLEGQEWSAPATLTVHVARAPWLRWWAIVLYALVVGAVALVIHRMRVRYLVGLERQRARIALDLHDEVGSGLGSIGLLATALPLLEDPHQAASTIAATSAELGDALTGIVWALRPESGEVANVLAFLEQRGRALFADGSTTLTVIGPSDASDTFTLPVLRTVTAISIEAMYNAARYADAERVEVRLASGDPWVLTVTDDGEGIDPDAPVRAGGGTGLVGMRERAASIGAELGITTGSHGTCVTLRFDPGAHDVRFS